MTACEVAMIKIDMKRKLKNYNLINQIYFKKINFSSINLKTQGIILRNLR